MKTVACIGQVFLRGNRHTTALIMLDPKHAALFRPKDIVRLSPRDDAGSIRYGELLVHSADAESGVVNCEGSISSAVPSSADADWAFRVRDEKSDHDHDYLVFKDGAIYTMSGVRLTCIEPLSSRRPKRPRCI